MCVRVEPHTHVAVGQEYKRSPEQSYKQAAFVLVTDLSLSQSWLKRLTSGD